jgi:hypothetical protein
MSQQNTQVVVGSDGIAIEMEAETPIILEGEIPVEVDGKRPKLMDIGGGMFAEVDDEPIVIIKR